MKDFGRRDADRAEQAIVSAIVADTSPQWQISRMNVDPMIDTLRARVLRQIDPASVSDLKPPVLHRQFEQVIHEIADEERYAISGREQKRLAEELTQDVTGYGPIEPLLHDEDVTDILVNAPDAVYVERHGKLELTSIRFRDNDHIAGLAQKIASRAGRHIDESNPMLDTRLPDGSRVNIVFPPLSLDSPCISVRKFTRRRLGLADMVDNGTMTSGVARLLGIAARARLNVLIAGGTGSGKTMLLNAMSNMIDSGERIVSIEDAAELRLQQRHVIRLETRPPDLSGNGQVTQRDLLRNALRMRPDRIIIGDVRGTEAFDMLQAMNTGHNGSMCTIHANNAREALVRVENMVQMGQFQLPMRAIRQQILGAIDLIVHVERMHDGVRRVTQLTDVRGLEGDTIATTDIAVFDFEREDPQGRIIGHYRAHPARPSFLARLDYYDLGRAWAAAEQAV
ncbi:CpaF family protein [Acidisphaera sp. S103]|uniref:CpaF family protein n=1 Tax=Acidisphaera sp. S103 TaxID=1747223 RepID=UPI001C203F74|nr:CpaF family protein [Acidisphaera sp. S103]